MVSVVVVMPSPYSGRSPQSRTIFGEDSAPRPVPVLLSVQRLATVAEPTLATGVGVPLTVAVEARGGSLAHRRASCFQAWRSARLRVRRATLRPRPGACPQQWQSRPPGPSGQRRPIILVVVVVAMQITLVLS